MKAYFWPFWFLKTKIVEQIVFTHVGFKTTSKEQLTLRKSCWRIERKELVDPVALETIFLPIYAYHWGINGICSTFLLKSNRILNFVYFYIFFCLDLTVLFKLPTKIQHHTGMCFEKVRLCSHWMIRSSDNSGNQFYWRISRYLNISILYCMVSQFITEVRLLGVLQAWEEIGSAWVAIYIGVDCNDIVDRFLNADFTFWDSKKWKTRFETISWFFWVL